MGILFCASSFGFERHLLELLGRRYDLDAEFVCSSWVAEGDRVERHCAALDYGQWVEHPVSNDLLVVAAGPLVFPLARMS